MPNNRGDPFEPYGEDYYSSRPHGRESLPRRSATARRSSNYNDHHFSGRRSTFPDREYSSNHTTPRRYTYQDTYQTTYSRYKDTRSGTTRSHTMNFDYSTSSKGDHGTTSSSSNANFSRRQSYDSNNNRPAESRVKDPTQGVDMRIVATIFVGIYFTFKDTTDSELKVLHMLNFLHSKRIYLSKEKIKDISLYMQKNRESHGTRFAVPETGRVGEFEKLSGLHSYWRLEGHKNCQFQSE